MTTLIESLNLSGGGVVAIVGAGGKTTLMFALADALCAIGDSVITTTTTKIRAPSPSQSPHLILAPSVVSLVDEAQSCQNPLRHLTAAARSDSTGDKLVGFSPDVIDELRGTDLAKWLIVEADGAAGRPLKAPGAHEPVIPGSAGWVVSVIGLDSVGAALTDEVVFRPTLFSSISGLQPGEPVSPTAIAKAIVHEDGLFKGTPAGAQKYLFLNKADTPERLAAARQIVTALDTPLDMRIVIGSARSDTAVIEIHDM
jgi:probable selenium-dependent hydroxylase accessory protein YqeC